jgi:hypothetical protein
MDTIVSTLILSQSFTFLLLIISETLALTNSPYSGIIHALILNLQNELFANSRQDS